MSIYGRVKRRRVLLGSAMGVLAGLRGARALSAVGAAGDPLAALGPWLDTLIPADESPAATALGVPDALVAQARKEKGALAFLEAGCRWLDSEAQRRGAANFAALAEPARDEIARATTVAAAGTAQRQFFDFTFRNATSHYYAHPVVWRTLGYNGPPQPHGFPNADQKP
jgi:hypothetical protein